MLSRYIKAEQIWATFLSCLLVFCCANFSYAVQLDDKGKINNTNVSTVISVNSEDDIIKGINLANLQHKPISIMAVQHSQGGQTLAHGAVVLNMLPFNHIVSFDLQHKQITVQSGITWGVLQDYINPYNLSIEAMQDSYIFSVGGSIGANAHGEDFRVGSMNNSVIGFHLVLSNGKKVYVTREGTPELWKSVFGGYGLLGVVSDVTLQLTDNNLLKGEYKKTNIDAFLRQFKSDVLLNSNADLFIARFNIVPGKNFLRDMYSVTSINTHQLPKKIVALKNPERWDFVLIPFFDLSRESILGKRARWFLENKAIKESFAQGLLSRNEVMRKAIYFATDHQSANTVDWLQEYFIPVDQLPNFVDTLRTLSVKNNINLLNVAVRYVPKNTDFLLTYAPQDCFSVVLYFQQDLSPVEIRKTKEWTQQLIDAALSMQGTYYLTYQNFATKQQFEEAYSNYAQFDYIKKKYDSGEVFSNKFYGAYFSN